MTADKRTDSIPSISILVPTYREKDNLEALVSGIHKALYDYNYEIVIVDDNSGDGTCELIHALSKTYPIRIVVRKDKRGLASAVADGFSFTSSGLIVVMDGDMQHPPEVIPSLMKELENGSDIVVASRYVEGGGCENWSTLRNINSKGAILLSHVLLPKSRKVLDPMSGFFALRRSVIEKAQLAPIGYKILLEVLIMGDWERASEVPFLFKCRTRGKSKLNIGQQIEYLKHLYRLMKRSGELSRFLKYCIVGGSGVIVDEGIFWLLTGFAGTAALAAGAISAEAAIISNYTFNNFYTFRDRRSPGINSFFQRLLKFNAVSLGGIALKLLVFWLLTVIFGEYDLLFNLCGIAAATIWNYSVNTRWTWK